MASNPFLQPEIGPDELPREAPLIAYTEKIMEEQLQLRKKKIELQTGRIRVAKQNEEQAPKVWEAASKAVKDEEAIKQKLCEDLNNLVQESSNSQFARLEELKRRLEALNPSRASAMLPHDLKPSGPANEGGASDSSLVSNTTENVANQRDGGKAAANGQNQQSKSEEEVRLKKKRQYQGRGKGIGAVPKGRGSAAPCWTTGAGFET